MKSVDARDELKRRKREKEKGTRYRAYIEINIQKDKHIVLYDYNTIVMKHFVSKETKKEKKN